jgi:hypothetical protein
VFYNIREKYGFIIKEWRKENWKERKRKLKKYSIFDLMYS